MSIDGLKNQITQAFGKHTVVPGDDIGKLAIRRFSSGSLALDVNLGGGYPEKRIIEIIGKESGGKSTLAYKAAATVTNLPDAHCKVAIMDAERSYEPAWAEALGVNIKNVDIYRTECAENYIDMIDIIMQSGEYRLVILDSVDAIVPKAIIEESSGKASMGVLAKLMGKFMRSTNVGIGVAEQANKPITLIIINQIRLKIGMIFGSPETTPGGLAASFYASIRIDIRKKEKLSEVGGNPYGQLSGYNIFKNKTAPPFRTGDIVLNVDGPRKGEFDNIADLVFFGTKYGFLQKTGSWYSGAWLGEAKVQGEEKTVLAISLDTPDQLNSKIRDLEATLGYPLCFKF